MSDQSSAPKPWEPPTSDQEFVFETLDAAPEWVDRSWAAADGIAVPHAPIGSDGPYTTDLARKGDTVKYKAKTKTFSVEHPEPQEDEDQDKPAPAA